MLSFSLPRRSRAHPIAQVSTRMEMRMSWMCRGSVRALTPQLGVRAVYTVYNQFEIEGSIVGMVETSFGDRTYRNVDIMIEGRYIASDHFKFGIGYRLMNFFGEDAAGSPNVDVLDMQLSGFYVNMNLIF